MSDDLERFRQFRFMRSRIPAQDALEIFVPDGSTLDEETKELQARTGQSRWYPVAGGHRLLILYQGGAFNAERLTLAKGAWDHEHCSRCGTSIAPMTLCWVTAAGPFVLLDEGCHEAVFGSGSAA